MRSVRRRMSHACGDHYGHNCTGYWISGDYFRQTSCRESVGNARESNIERERVGMKDNEVTGSQKEDKSTNGARENRLNIYTTFLI